MQLILDHFIIFFNLFHISFSYISYFNVIFVINFNIKAISQLYI